MFTHTWGLWRSPRIWGYLSLKFDKQVIWIKGPSADILSSFLTLSWSHSMPKLLVSTFLYKTCHTQMVNQSELNFVFVSEHNRTPVCKENLKTQKTNICMQSDKKWLLNFLVLPVPVSNDFPIYWIFLTPWSLISVRSEICQKI